MVRRSSIIHHGGRMNRNTPINLFQEETIKSLRENWKGWKEEEERKRKLRKIEEKIIISKREFSFFHYFINIAIARVDIAEKWTRPGEFPSEEEEEEEEEEEDEGMF